ncbi:hypothetical protein [Nitrosospira sp. Nsp1]|nr:hypothetical protein [Nitrosospira sp. Nsp1]
MMESGTHMGKIVLTTGAQHADRNL